MIIVLSEKKDHIFNYKSQCRRKESKITHFLLPLLYHALYKKLSH